MEQIDIENRGGTRRVDIAHGAYVFCYRPLGEFA